MIVEMSSTVAFSSRKWKLDITLQLALPLYQGKEAWVGTWEEFTGLGDSMIENEFCLLINLLLVFLLGYILALDLRFNLVDLLETYAA